MGCGAQVNIFNNLFFKFKFFRFLGNTKSQWLDKLMRSNANICALISLSFFPIVAYYSWRSVNGTVPRYFRPLFFLPKTKHSWAVVLAESLDGPFCRFKNGSLFSCIFVQILFFTKHRRAQDFFTTEGSISLTKVVLETEQITKYRYSKSWDYL